jgi:hypothetical protein
VAAVAPVTPAPSKRPGDADDGPVIKRSPTVAVRTDAGLAVRAAPAPAPADTAAGVAASATCGICHCKPQAPFQSPCGHLACYLCWQTALTTALACPLCGAKTRMRQLAKVYFL